MATDGSSMVRVMLGHSPCAWLRAFSRDRQQHRAAPFAAAADPWIKRMIVRMTAPQIPAAMNKSS